MFTLRNRLMKAAISLGIMGAAAGCAGASQFKITLPMAAQWGRAYLSAGDYTITTVANSPALEVSGNGKTVCVLAATASRDGDQNKSYVRLVNVNGRQVIQQFTSAASGTTYNFLLPPAKSIHGS